MKNKIFEQILNKKSGDKYDVAVMYSGGKDSAYLLYLLKEVYHKKVIAVIVDNGFENEYMWYPMEKFAKKMDISLKVLSPGKELFCQLFRMLIKEREQFQREGINHVCFICNNILWGCVSRFAYEENIPYVASGLSYAQLNSGRTYPLNLDELANSIAEKSTRVIFRNAVQEMKNTENFKKSEELQEFVQQLGEGIRHVKTIYPYLYHILSVDELKSKIEECGWEPPKPIGVKEYISSGCEIMRYVVSELEKLGIVTLNEREQAKAMIKDGLMDEAQLKFANYDARNDVVNLSSKLMEELQIKDYLKDMCESLDKEVIC